MTDDDSLSQHNRRVINLAEAPGEQEAWDRPKLVIYLWAIAELLFVTNAWQISSSLRVAVLRLFGAKIGNDVIMRPRTRVRFPWKLEIGDRCWVGEGVWIHNQAYVRIGHDAVLSQETFITTGSHAHRRDMGLLMSPIQIGSGAWVTSRCIVLGGSEIGTNALITPGTIVQGKIPSNVIYGCAPAGVRGNRF